MAEAKTQKNKASVTAFLADVEDPQRRKDCQAVRKMMAEITGSRAAMWGDAIIGFGANTITYANGREAEWFLCGFSPRKQNLTLYIMSGFRRYDALLKKLGKHKIGKSCLYLKSLADVDESVLCDLISESVAHLRNKK